MKKIGRKDIGYYGQPIEALPREELIKALVELANMLHTRVSGPISAERRDTRRNEQADKLAS